MAKKDVAVKKAAAAVQAAQSKGEKTEKKTLKTKSSLSQTFTEVSSAIRATYNEYLQTLTPRLKLIDLFLVFLVALGVLQFVYVLAIGNFPFNAFLGGFNSCVGQFVLTVSLRLQYASATPGKGENSDELRVRSIISPFSTISPERAFGDYIFASLILHFIVFHFIN